MKYKKKYKKRKEGEIYCGEGKEGERYCHRRSRAPSCNVYFRFVAHERAQTHILSFSHWHLHCTFPCAATNASYKTYLFYIQKRNCSSNKCLWNNRYKGHCALFFRFNNRWYEKTRIASKCRILERDHNR